MFNISITYSDPAKLITPFLDSSASLPQKEYYVYNIIILHGLP